MRILKKHRILVVEDERKIAGIVKDYLENAGYSVNLLHNGNDVLPQIKKSLPDLIVLDIMLPGKDGMAICREIRKTSDVPVIMLTARVEEIDRLLGLELGADDYLCKPFSPRELVARVKAILRRADPEPKEKILARGPIVVDPFQYRIMISGQALEVTRSEFDLMKIFISHPGQVFSRGDLIAKVQGYEYDGYDRTIDSHIKNLRKKLSDHLPGQKIIKTVYGVGYTFNREFSVS